MVLVGPGARGAHVTGWLSTAAAVVGKDLRFELRSREILVTSGFFGLLVVLVFAFSFFRGDAPLSVVAAGILWVAVAFSGALTVGRVFDREKEEGGLQGLMLTPSPPGAVFLGKLATVFVLMVAIEVVVLTAVIFFFSLPTPWDRLLPLAGVLALGSFGFAAVGCLLSAMLLNTRGREVLLVLVLYPLVLPVLIIGVKATTALLEPDISWIEFGIWLRVLTSFDIIFGAAGAWLFEPVALD